MKARYLILAAFIGGCAAATHRAIVAQESEAAPTPTPYVIGNDVGTSFNAHFSAIRASCDWKAQRMIVESYDVQDAPK